MKERWFKMKEFFGINSSDQEKKNREKFCSLYKNSPIPDMEQLRNFGLYMNRQSVTRLLFMNELYQNILDINGVVIEFGVRWGQNLSYFINFRGIYEPYNLTRKIIGFDTFSGFESVNEKDGRDEVIKEGFLSVTKDYDEHLESILEYQESECTLSHLKKFELVKGDATKTIKEYLERNPQTVIALAYFDLDLYEPTKECLKAILPFLTKGSIIGFDELNAEVFPGETIAFREVLGNNFKIEKSKMSSQESFIVYE